MKEKREEQKQHSKTGLILILTIFFLIVAVAGYCLVRYLVGLQKEGSMIPGLLYAALCAWVTNVIQGAIHEAGHLFFGLISGYTFGFYRVRGFAWIRQEGRIRFRRFSVAGTGGQCLMVPPEFGEKGIPYVLYNMGGILLNLLTAVLAVYACLVLGEKNWYRFIFLVLFAFNGVWMALVSAIPVRGKLVNSDGRNILECARNKEGMRAFWVQLKIAEYMAKDVRIKYMPEEWFRMTENATIQRAMPGIMAMYSVKRLMDEHRFEEAAEKIEGIEETAHSLSSLQRFLLTTDRVFCELVGSQKEDVLDRWNDRKNRSLAEKLENQISVMRTQYAYALLKEKNKKKAEKIRKTFEIGVRFYPFRAEVQGERELMDLAEQRAEQSDENRALQEPQKCEGI